MTADNREAILRRLQALKAMFEHKDTSEAEAMQAMALYAKLMEKYDLTETDLSVKQAGVGFRKVKNSETKHEHEVAFIVLAIEALTETRIVPVKGNEKEPGLFHVIHGTRSDVDYAEFIYRLCYNAIETSWKAYRYSYEYTKLVKKQGIHGRKVRSNFRLAMAYRLADRINAMAKERHAKQAGTSLIVLKSELIKVAFPDLKQGNAIKGKNLAIKDDSVKAAWAGFEAGNKVELERMLKEQEEAAQEPIKLLGAA